MSSPTYLETFRAVVSPEDCDALGHMNVQHYYRAVSSGMFVVMEHLGLNLPEITRRKLSFAVVRAETDFRRELRAGDAFALDSTITQVGEKLVVFHHRLWTMPADGIAMTTDYKCVLLDLERRRAVPVPDDIRSAAVAVFRNVALGQGCPGATPAA